MAGAQIAKLVEQMPALKELTQVTTPAPICWFANCSKLDLRASFHDLHLGKALDLVDQACP
jgi:hypothetical protein